MIMGSIVQAKSILVVKYSLVINLVVFTILILIYRCITVFNIGAKILVSGKYPHVFEN